LIDARELEGSSTLGLDARRDEPASQPGCGDRDVEENFDAGRVDERQRVAVDDHVTVTGGDVPLEALSEMLGACHVDLADD
jgi:hypothetical protein